MRKAIFAMRQAYSLYAEKFKTPELSAGKATLFTVVGSTIVLTIGLFVFFEFNVPQASADDVSTAVTVLNTPPNWTLYAQEIVESSTTTPTNVGSTVSWQATATDSNAESYYLIICKASSTPTANSGAVPDCGGGIGNRWAVSALTASGAEATVSTTTIETFPFDQEGNAWYAYICDANASLPRCNGVVTQGRDLSAKQSPFVVNHPPVFALVSHDGPVDPGDTITWTATAYDNDATGTPDTVQLFVCKANDFNGSYCGAGGSWATSTFAASNPATTTTIAIPSQDKAYDAYVFLQDSHNLVATSTTHGSNSTFDVSNVAPSITASTIFITTNGDTEPLILATPVGTSGPFKVTFTVVDNNSCENSASGNELSYAVAAAYRSGVGQSGCTDASHFNSNNCYAATSTLMTNYSCVQATSTGNLCTGSSDPDVTWMCRFSMWYNSDPTDATTPWTSEFWLSAARIQDDDNASSTFTGSTDADGTEMQSFLAFNVSSTSIFYSSLEPGQSMSVSTTSDLIAQGNVGLDEDIYGSTMCTNFSALGGPGNPDACDTDGVNPANDIPATTTQKVATSSLAYTHAETYFIGASTTALDFSIRVPKTTATSSPEVKYNYWGISIPSAVTLAGSYTGQNTITGKKSNPSFW